MQAGDFLAHLQRTAFAPGAPGDRPHLGLEVEFIPVDAVTRRPVPIVGTEGVPGSLAVVRTLAARCNWREVYSSKAGVPSFHLPAGGAITYEPGGQIEYSAAPAPGAGTLLDDVQGVVGDLRDALSAAGIDVLTQGIDPLTAVDDVPLQLTGDRYRRMDAHFAALGPSGRRMMRQTASIQVCLDTGADPPARYALLNALAPYVVAVFANSPVYRGVATGHQSFRRHVWGTLDTSRTGLAVERHGRWSVESSAWARRSPVSDAVTAYRDFALGAASLFDAGDAVPYGPFAGAARAGCSEEAWERHLSTLFPEVRPRGYFEVRSCDALAPEWYAAPLAFLAGLALVPRRAAEAREVIGAADGALLERAGRCGVHDPALGAGAAELFALALAGCADLGPAVFPDAHLAAAHRFHDRYTRRRRAPADDFVLAAAVA